MVKKTEIFPLFEYKYKLHKKKKSLAPRTVAVSAAGIQLVAWQYKQSSTEGKKGV